MPVVTAVCAQDCKLASWELTVRALDRLTVIHDRRTEKVQIGTEDRVVHSF